MNPLLGTITLFAFNYAPQGWLLCDGRTMPGMQNQALFALLSTTYGGDGTTNFNLPNLVGKSPLPGMGYYICYEGAWPQRPE